MRDEIELTDERKWNLMVGVSRYKLHTQKKNNKIKIEPTYKVICVFVR